MKKTTKKITNFLLAIILVLGLMPTPFAHANASQDPKAIAIEIDDVKLIEGQRVEYIYPENGDDSWMRYDFEWICFNFSAIMDDGTKIDSLPSGWINYHGISERPTIEVEQSAERPLIVGNTYPAKISIWGAEAEFNITIIENPATSVSMNKTSVELVEGCHGITQNDGTYAYQLRSYFPGYAVTMKDGSVYYSEGDDHYLLYEGIYYDFSVYEPEMTANGFKQRLNILGIESDEIDVTIIPSPVQSINFAPVTIRESDGQTFSALAPDGTPIEMVVYLLGNYIKDFTITLKDGTILESDDTGTVIYKDIEYQLSTGALVTSETVKPGKNKVKCSVMNADGYLDLTILCNNHTYKEVTTKATPTKNGSIAYECVCGTTKPSTTIYKASDIKLSPSSYVYNGKKKAAPKVIVKDSKGKTISSKYYSISKPKKTLKDIGTYTYTVTFKGTKYTGTKKLTLTIAPPKTTIKTPAPAKKAVTVKWTKGKKSVTSGYEILLATNKSFTKNKKTVTVKGYNNASKKVTGLKAKSTYYMKIRTYKTVSGKKIYSDWSKVKSCKTK